MFLITIPTGIFVEVGELTLNITWKPRGKDCRVTEGQDGGKTAHLLEAKAPTRKRGGTGPPRQTDERSGAESPPADPHTQTPRFGEL